MVSKGVASSRPDSKGIIMKRLLSLVLALNLMLATGALAQDVEHGDNTHGPAQGKADAGTAVTHDGGGHGVASHAATGGHAQGAASGGHQEDAVTPFAGTIFQSAAAVIVFLILLGILKWKAWGPILKGLQDRENKIKHDLAEAERAARQATATLAEYHTKLAAAQAEARSIIEKSKLDAERVAAQVQEETRQELAQQKTRALAEIQYAKEQAVSDLYAQAAEIGTHVASRILKREIRPQDQQQLVQESLQQLRAETLN
jgi:F-type H+-transporting ATPase subunit b